MLHSQMHSVQSHAELEPFFHITDDKGSTTKKLNQIRKIGMAISCNLQKVDFQNTFLLF
jgi:hypothetical protein